MTLLFVSSICAVQAQDNTESVFKKNEYALNIMPYFNFFSGNVNQFAMYRRRFDKNALRVSFYAHTHQTNRNEMDMENMSFQLKDSAFSISKTGSFGGLAGLRAGYERHFNSGYPNIDLYVGADIFAGMGGTSKEKYVWNFQQQSDSSYTYTAVNNDDPVIAKVRIMQVGISPVIGLHVNLGKRFFAGGETGFNFYQEWQKNRPKYPEFRATTFNFAVVWRILLGVKF